MWTTGPFYVGECKIPPLTFQLDQSRPAYKPQYKVSPEATEGLKYAIGGLLSAGVIKLTCSPWNIPLLPVLKADGKSFRMEHYL